MSGSELITALKSESVTASIPVVILAGKQSGFDEKKEKRADFAIFKDIDIEVQLGKALRAILGNRAAKGKGAGR